MHAETGGYGYGPDEMLRRGVSGAVLKPMRMLQFQKHFLDWLRDRLPDDGFYTFPAMAARLTPGDLGNQMRGLLNRRQRAAGQPDIVPYIPTMSPPRTPSPD